MFHFHLTSGQETLLGVAVGAILASLGGLLAGQFEHHLRRREREQSAALLFGEILAALKLILRLANEARGRGDPYGPITLRILKAAHRETLIYDRNRETLFDLRDAALRARTHLLLLQLGLTMDSVFEADQLINDIGDQAQLSETVQARLNAAMENRHGSFNFLMELHGAIPALIPQYEKLARQPFDVHDVISQLGVVTQPAVAAAR
jgi:hypothetical protein